MLGFLDFLYILFIWPARFVIEFLFLIFKELFHENTGPAIVFLSLAVNTMLLPIYTVADRWQDEERDIQNRMKRRCKQIRAVFKGDEQQMILAAYYRQMGYSPLQGLKSSVGLLLQIPFFVAAYQLLSHSPSLQGVSLLVIQNLGQEDSLLKIGSFSFNVLPLLMTITNLFSAFVYAKGLSLREKIQLPLIALIFLVLLYHSPSGLVLYWTVNNLFSLGKNLVIKKCPSPKRVLRILGIIVLAVAIAVLLSGFTGINRYRNVIIALCFCTIALLAAGERIFRLARLMPLRLPAGGGNFHLFLSAALLAALITGFLIPAQVIASSPVEFPEWWAVIWRTLAQGMTFCFLLPLLLWVFTPPNGRPFLAFGLTALVLAGTASSFVFGSAYGTMTRSFRFENSYRLLDAFPPALSILILAGGILITGVVFLYKKQKWLRFLFHAAGISAVILGFFSISSIQRELRGGTLPPAGIDAGIQADSSGPGGFLKLTSTGKNTFFFFIDAAAGIAFNKVLEYSPDIKQKLDGFVWYPNTVSFANFTVSGQPALFGGYDYTPTAMAERKDQSLEDKINESFALLPRIFGEADWRVVITDPPIAQSRTIPATVFFNRMKNVQAKNIEDYFVHQYKERFPENDEKFIESFDFDILFRYGLFRIAPPVFRYALYYNGRWWRDGRSNGYERALSTFSTLYFLPELCAVDKGPDTLAIFMNETTHEPAAFTADLRPIPGSLQYSAEEKTAFGPGEDIGYTYSYLAVMQSIEKWIAYLKEQGVYDNTRIIIVSDHGRGYANSQFEEAGMERFNPLLLVKERNSHGELYISGDLMTNADAPLFALQDFANPVNPFLNTPINNSAKYGSITVYETPAHLKDNIQDKDPYSYKTIRSRTLRGGSIFQASSWEPWR